MDKLVVAGSSKLNGEVTVSGSKNACLPILAACLMTDDECIIRGVPELVDITRLSRLMGELGVNVRPDADDPSTMRVQVDNEKNCEARYDLVRQMRASICVMGPLVAKRAKAIVSQPGGCAIGDRPINLHLHGLVSLGAQYEQTGGGNICVRAKRLNGAEIFLGGPFGSSVLATANVMSAACLAKGSTLIESAACEPEIVDLADFLNKMGAKITGQGSPRITIEGVEKLGGAEHTVIPDRIEAGTFMIAGAMSGGEVTVKNCRLDHMLAVVDNLRRIGAKVEKANGTDVLVRSQGRFEPVDITTQPYPGFPTDLQAQFMALLCLAKGNSVVTDKVFPDRFLHVGELGRMGAQLRKQGPAVVISGVKELVGAPVMASDLRASAALVLAGIVAEGTTEIHRVYHIDRGYQRIEEKLNALGADIQRLPEEVG